MKLTIRTADDIAQDERTAKADAKRAEAQAYLAETDWFVTRQVETGKAVPDDIAEKRAEARKQAHP